MAINLSATNSTAKGRSALPGQDAQFHAERTGGRATKGQLKCRRRGERATHPVGEMEPQDEYRLDDPGEVQDICMEHVFPA
jgi:hypothetical protein